jgi:3-oxoacyl-[acyl-carrier protein] reductase
MSETTPLPPVLEPFLVTGRVACVTGAASGIGRATAQILAAAGARVVCCDINDTGAELVAKQIVEDGGEARSLRVDVSQREDLEAAVACAVDEFGQLDIMVNNAGIPVDGPLIETSEEELDRALAVNLKGVVFGCQAALTAMGPRKSGSIINVASGAIDAPKEGYGVYAITKAGVAMLTQTLSLEAGPLGVRVNAIAPGVTWTNFVTRHAVAPDGSEDPARLEAFRDNMQSMSPLGMLGDAEDQALQILYLASDAARYCTGQIFRANGGQCFGR